MMPEISHLLCSELPTWDHGLERASVKMIAFFLPSATMTREQSQHYWTHEHVRVGTTLNDPTPYAPRYVQNHTLPDFHAEKHEYDFAGAPEIGRAHVRTPVTNAHIVSRLLLEKNEKHTY